MQGIYRILNLVNGKCYVGSAQNIRERWYMHKWALRNDYDSSYLQNAFNKYGARHFILEILEEVKGSRKEILDREQVYLDEGFAEGLLYNLARKAGGGNFGPKVNQKIREAMTGRKVTWGDKISKAIQMLWLDPEYRARQEKSHTDPKYLQGLSKRVTEQWQNNPERRERQSKMAKVRWQNPEHCSEISKSMKKRWEDSEYQECISQKTTESWTDPEIRANRIEGIKRHCQSPEVREQRSKTMKGNWQDPEYRAKMLAARTNKATIEAREKMSLNSGTAAAYPSFVNDFTGKFIPGGHNLKRMCRIYGLNYAVIGYVARRQTKRTRGGWRLAE